MSLVSPQVEPIGRNVVNSTAVSDPPMPRRSRNAPPETTGGAVDADGIDRAQIRAFLKLTPAERLTTLQQFVNAVQQVRKLNDA